MSIEINNKVPVLAKREAKKHINTADTICPITKLAITLALSKNKKLTDKGQKNKVGNKAITAIPE